MPENSYRSTGYLLDKILKTYQLDDKLYRQRIFNIWAEIIGNDLAKVCQPVRLEGEILTLKVKNQIWRQELGNKEKELLNSIKTKTNVSKISKIIFI